MHEAPRRALERSRFTPVVNSDAPRQLLRGSCRRGVNSDAPRTRAGQTGPLTSAGAARRGRAGRAWGSPGTEIRGWPRCAGRPVADHQDGDDGADRAHARLAGDHRPKPRLHVKPSEELLHVADGALDLDDQKDAGAGVPRNNIHPTAVAEVIEAHLDSRDPAQRRQELRRPFLQRGMPGIQEAIELFTAPSQVQVDPGS
jgi:hypothetical protein